MAFNVAIDGPAGAGKSTIAKSVAAELNYIYVDTGAMYRAIALYLLRNGIEATDSAAISERCKEAKVSIQYVDGKQVVLLNGEDVNPYIRTEEVGNMASSSSVHPDVRVKLVELQRQLAQKADVVMDGRDIGTHVLPDANLKIYLTASTQVRAERRYEELIAKGEACDLDRIELDIMERDTRDMTREISPLRQAEDAILIDSSEMTIDEVVEAVVKLCFESGAM